MTKKEMIVAAKLLELAAYEFANHGCNDLDPDLEKMFTKKEFHE